MKPRYRNHRLADKLLSHKHLQLESLECRRLLAGDGLDPVDVEPPFRGAISGLKWEDLDRDGERDRDEPGLAGVRIFIDENTNGRFDPGERSALTRRDHPQTEIDESGFYALRGLEEGRYLVREVVPLGFIQTFPHIITDDVVTDDTPHDLARGAHVVFVPAGEHVPGIDFGNHRLDVEPASVRGVKWEDLNGNGERDGNEPGLAGVTIYSDLNRNGRLDRGEPLTRTSRDLPETDFDEGGMYQLSGLRPGAHIIREVVPEGYVQTFPGRFEIVPVDDLPADDTAADEFATAEPRRLDLVLPAAETEVAEVAMTIHPYCLVPIEVDVIASDRDVDFQNLSGVHLNGCGGDVSKFEVAITSDGEMHKFEILFVNAATGDEITSIPVTINSPHVRGGHRLELDPGEAADGIDFGNRPIATGAIRGSKWLDANGNGEREDDEPGLAGVTIYLDRNGNRRLDPGEPATITARDNRETPEDETGRYRFAGLRPGEYTVREVVPRGFDQTFPGVGAEVVRSVTGRFNPGVALDLDLTDVEAHLNDDDSLDATVDVTVTWPDTCGTIKDGETMQAVVGNHLLIEISGHQVGDACAEAISPQTVAVEFPAIKPGRYDVVVTLHEDLPDESNLPTLTAAGLIAVGGPGQHVVIVGLNETVDGIDFGNQSELDTASVHGEKWLDRNGDGQRGPNERGVAGITVYSDINFNGQLDEGEPHAVTMVDDPTTRIDESGHYWLEKLEPGQHLINEILPEGFERTFPPPTGILAPWPLSEPYYFNLVAGQILTGIDFGNHPIGQESGAVHGSKWADLNGNGQRENNEAGLAGVTIYLDANLNNRFDQGEPATRTMRDNPITDFDETGMYWINDVDPGFYIVREIIPPGFRQTFPEEMACDAIFCSGRGHIINIDPGQSVDGLDFGNQPVREPGSIHGVKWLDRDGDGKRDDDEPGLPGVTIYADLNRNGSLDRHEPRTQTMRDNPSTRRDERGMYWLNVLPGEHLILEVVPEGFEQTFPNPHRRIIFPLNLGHLVQVSPGAPVEGIDFGNQPIAAGAVEGVKWLDRNANGERDRNEPGLPGVVVFADLNRNGQRDADEPATRTRRDNPRTDIDETGHYRLDGLRPGEHVIREVVPRGFAATFPTARAQVGDQTSNDLPPGRALSYELVGAALDPSVDGETGIELTVAVVWPDGCGTLLPEQAEAKVDGNQIHVQMYGTQVGTVCTLALKTERQTIHIDAPLPGTYAVEALLSESTSPDSEFLPAFEMKAVVSVLQRASHHVEVAAGETVRPLNFGNRPVLDFHAADFNMDGDVNGPDIDMLGIAIRASRHAGQYDLTGDGQVNERDFDHLVRDVVGVPFGDSNLDGIFDSSDLIKVFQAGKYETDVEDSASWEEGDWNGDGNFNSSDLIYVFQKGSYGAHPSAVDAAFAD